MAKPASYRSYFPRFKDWNEAENKFRETFFIPIWQTLINNFRELWRYQTAMLTSFCTVITNFLNWNCEERPLAKCNVRCQNRYQVWRNRKKREAGRSKRRQERDRQIMGSWSSKMVPEICQTWYVGNGGFCGGTGILLPEHGNRKAKTMDWEWDLIIHCKSIKRDGNFQQNATGQIGLKTNCIEK